MSNLRATGWIIASVFSVASCSPSPADRDFRDPEVAAALENAAAAIEPTESEPVDRQQLREATARWWIVAASPVGIALVERQAVGDRRPKKTAWTQIVFALPEDGMAKSMMQVNFDCVNGTYSTARRIDYDPKGRRLADTAPEPVEHVAAPETFGAAELSYVCQPGSTLFGPFPLVRDPEGAAKVAAFLVEGGENGDIAGLLASLDPVEDAAQIHHIVTRTLRPQNRAKVTELIGYTPPAD